MKKFLIFVGTMVFFTQIHLLLKLAPLIQFSQDICLKSAPNSLFRDYFDALICGKNLPQNQIKELFTRIGLFHLMIVSGAHLHLLVWFAEKVFKIKKDHPGLLFIFALYTLLTGFQPHLVRVFAVLLLNVLSEKLKLGWDNLTAQIYSGFVCIALFPEWVQSLSLQFSWLAGLALSTSIYFVRLKPWKKNLTVGFILQILLFAPLAQLHPLICLFNLILNPVFLFFLFPLSLLTFCFHFLTPIFDALFSLFLKVVSELSASVDPATTTSPSNPMSYWLYIFTLIFILHSLRVHFERGRQ